MRLLFIFVPTCIPLPKKLKRPTSNLSADWPLVPKNQCIDPLLCRGSCSVALFIFLA